MRRQRAFGIALGAVLVLAAVLFALLLHTRRVALRRGREYPPDRFVTVEGLRIHYRVAGTGPPVVLLHGMASTSLAFAPLVPELQDDFTTYAFDRPGCGYSQRSHHRPTRLARQAQIIAKAIETLGLDRPVVVGHSYGASLAAALAVYFPDRERAIVLCSGPATARPEFEETRLSRALYGLADTPVARWTVMPAVVPLLTDRGLAAAFAPAPVPPAYRDAMVAFLQSPEQLNAIVEDTGTLFADLAAVEPRWGEIRIPTIVLHGTADAVVDPTVHPQVFADRIPTAELHLLDGVNHMLPQVRPDVVAGYVRQVAGAPPPD